MTQIDQLAARGSHQRQVLNLAHRYCGDRQISEDLTQDIFLKVYLNAGNLEESGYVFEGEVTEEDMTFKG